MFRLLVMRKDRGSASGQKCLGMISGVSVLGVAVLAGSGAGDFFEYPVEIIYIGKA